MRWRYSLFILLSSWVFNLFGQQASFTLHSSVSLKRDSIEKQKVLRSLDAFLQHLGKFIPDSTNNDLQQLSTLALTEEMVDSGLSWQVIQLVRMNDSLFRLQLLSFRNREMIGHYEILALKRSHRYCIMSPMWWNVRHWNKRLVRGVDLYYPHTINKAKAKKFVALFRYFNQIIGANYRQTYFLCCDDLHDALQITGVLYKVSLAGFRSGSVSCKWQELILIVDGNLTSGFNEFDPHDLWHYCLYKWKPRSTWNKPVDEGCAYLYGGSWGLSWQQILQQFHAYADTIPTFRWLELHQGLVEFSDSSAQPLYVSYVLNALIIEQLQAKSGYEAVRALLACGPFQKGNENYFHVLDTYTGINPANFNERIRKLIDQSR